MKMKRRVLKWPTNDAQKMLDFRGDHQCLLKIASAKHQFNFIWPGADLTALFHATCQISSFPYWKKFQCHLDEASIQ